MKPQEIADLIIQSEQEAQKQFWFIPSENLPSPMTRMSLATSSVNRYLFQYQHNGQRFCPGTEHYQRLYDYCVETLADIYQARFVSLKPLSGMNAMTMVIAAHTPKDGLVMALAPLSGGHTHTVHIVELLGRRLQNIPMAPTGDGWYDVDYELLAKQIQEMEPSLIYLDPMSYLYQFDLALLREITPQECRLHYDISHVMAFVAGGYYPNPLQEDYSSLGGSTHKTLPAAQKAFFATNDQAIYEYFHTKAGQLISSYHTSSILALAMTLAETAGFFKTYATKIRANTDLFGDLLTQRGFTLMGRESKKSDNHVLFVSLDGVHDHVDAAWRLSQCHLIVHPLMMPGLKSTPGLRLGLQELTLLGLEEPQLIELADIFQKVILEGEDPGRFAGQVEEMRRSFKWPVTSYMDQERLDKLSGLLAG